MPSQQSQFPSDFTTSKLGAVDRIAGVLNCAESECIADHLSRLHDQSAKLSKT